MNSLIRALGLFFNSLNKHHHGSSRSELFT